MTKNVKRFNNGAIAITIISRFALRDNLFSHRFVVCLHCVAEDELSVVTFKQSCLKPKPLSCISSASDIKQLYNEQLPLNLAVLNF